MMVMMVMRVMTMMMVVMMMMMMMMMMVMMVMMGEHGGGHAGDDAQVHRGAELAGVRGDHPSHPEPNPSHRQRSWPGDGIQATHVVRSPGRECHDPS
jgi:hypothetical protein